MFPFPSNRFAHIAILTVAIYLVLLAFELSLEMQSIRRLKRVTVFVRVQEKEAGDLPPAPPLDSLEA